MVNLKNFTVMKVNQHIENRDKLYWKEGPCEVGTMGVWMWRAVPNNTNPNKDYIYSRFASELKPIEMISIHQVSVKKTCLIY